MCTESVFETAEREAAERRMQTVCCGRSECGGECGNEWRGMEDPAIAEADVILSRNKVERHDAQALQIERRAQSRVPSHFWNYV